MIRVIHYVKFLDRGGTEAFIFNNLDKMDREEIQFDFIVARDIHEERENDLVKYGCRKYVVGGKSKNKILNYIQTYKSIKRFLEESDYRIIHFESNPPGITATAPVLAAKSAKIPVRILHSHSAGSIGKRQTAMSLVIQNVCRFINVACCTDYVAPSPFAAEYGFGKSVVKKKAYHEIINGINTRHYQFDNCQRERIRSEYKLDDSFVIGSVGRLSKIKNFDLLIEVFAGVKKQLNNVKLMIVGGELQSEKNVMKALGDLTKKLGVYEDVIFAGQQNDVLPFLCAMDLFAVTSETEALCIAALEAQLTGLQVVAKKGSVPAEADINQAILWIPQNGDTKDWVNTICTNIEDKAERKNVDFTSEKVKNVDTENTSKLLYALYREKVSAFCGEESKK